MGGGFDLEIPPPFVSVQVSGERPLDILGARVMAFKFAAVRGWNACPSFDAAAARSAMTSVIASLASSGRAGSMR